MKKIVFTEMAARPEGEAGEQQKTGSVAFSRLMAAEKKVGVATISGYIGYGNATVDEFNKSLEELKAEGCTQLEIVMNSMGGNLFEASGIYDLIKGCGMEVTAKIYGVAASAATLISCAASRVLISENSRYMVHRAQGCAMGNVDEIGGYLKDLKSTEDQILGIYAARTGKGTEDVMNILKAETWMNAETAVAEGWCDEVISASVDTGEKKEGEDQPDGGGEGAPDAETAGKKSPTGNAVLRRMMQALGITTTDSVEDLEREVSRLVEENERLAAENDGYRGMQTEQARIMAAHEEELARRVQEGVVREMAAQGVPPASLPPVAAGWLRGARLAGLKKVPAWIARHASVYDGTASLTVQGGRVRFEMYNDPAYPDRGQLGRVAAYAVDSAGRDMRRVIKGYAAKLKKELNK